MARGERIRANALECEANAKPNAKAVHESEMSPKASMSR